MASATAGNTGYIGTLKGRLSAGSFFLRMNKEIIARIYNVNAPKTDIVIITEVFPEISAMIPITIFPSKAFAGVLNFEEICPKNDGRF